MHAAGLSSTSSLGQGIHFCRRCGERRAPGTSCCLQCGADRRTADCPRCGAPSLSGSRFCCACGTPCVSHAGVRRGNVLGTKVVRLAKLGAFGVIVCGVLIIALIIVAAARLAPSARVDGLPTVYHSPAAAAGATRAPVTTEPTPIEELDASRLQVEADAPPGVLALDPIPRPAVDQTGHEGFNFFADVKLPKPTSKGDAPYTLRLTLADAANLSLYSRSAASAHADTEGRLRATREIITAAGDGDRGTLRTSLLLRRDELLLPVGRQVLNLTATLVDAHGQAIGRPALARWHHVEEACYVTRVGLGNDTSSFPGERSVQVSLDFMCPPMSGGRGQIVARFLRPVGAPATPAAPAASRELAVTVTDFAAPPTRQLCRGVVWTVPPDRLPFSAPQLTVELRFRNATTGEPLGNKFTISAERLPDRADR